MESSLLTQFNLLKFQLFLRKMGWSYFKEGIYYTKLLEYPLVFNELKIFPGCKILDIGAGKSFLPLYLFSLGVEVWVVDKGEFYPDFDKFYIEMQRMIFSEKRNFFKIVKGDFLKTDFPLNYYDRIYAISTVEHFRNQDDIKAMLRLKALLKSQGIFVCSIPFSQSGTKERTIRKGDFVYFQRDYELECVYKRIIDPSGLRLKYFIVIGERNPYLARVLFFHPPFSKVRVLSSLSLSNYFWKVYYKGKTKSLKQIRYPGVIIIVLEKEK